jgi:hypothetical protein
MQAAERVMAWCRQHYLPSPLNYSSTTATQMQDEQELDEPDERANTSLEASADDSDSIEVTQPNDSAGQ